MPQNMTNVTIAVTAMPVEKKQNNRQRPTWIIKIRRSSC